MCAGHDVLSGGASPLRAEVIGTARLSKGVAVKQGLKEADDEIRDLTNRNWI
jgi:hypothetical protein